MKFRILLLLAAIALPLRAEQTPFGIVYGPKAAFNITAPKGWVIDNSAGARDGLPCVLYRKGATWENADPLMYAKIASTEIENAEAFAKKAIEEMKKDRGEYEVKRVASGKTKDGHPWFVNEYSPNDAYPRFERVAYVQLPQAVAYIVYSADDKAVFREQRDALQELLGSFTYLKPKEK